MRRTWRPRRAAAARDGLRPAPHGDALVPLRSYGLLDGSAPDPSGDVAGRLLFADVDVDESVVLGQAPQRDRLGLGQLERDAMDISGRDSLDGDVGRAAVT